MRFWWNWSLSSPAVTDGRVFIGTSWEGGDVNASIYCLNSSDGSFILAIRNRYSRKFFTAVVDGKVFIGANDTVYCLNETTGENIWGYKTGEYIGRISSSI